MDLGLVTSKSATAIFDNHYKRETYRLSRILLANLRLRIDIIVVMMTRVRLLLTSSELVGNGAFVLCILVSTIQQQHPINGEQSAKDILGSKFLWLCFWPSL